MNRQTTLTHKKPQEQPSKLVSLRLKLIVISSIVIFLTSIFDILFIYNKASKQLDSLINQNGSLIVKILSSIDSEYWVRAITKKKNSVPANIKSQIASIFALEETRLSEGKLNLALSDVNSDPKYGNIYKKFLSQYISSLNKCKSCDLIESGLSSSDIPQFIADMQAISGQEVYQRIVSNNDFKTVVAQITIEKFDLDPFSSIRNLQKSSDIRQISVGYFESVNDRNPKSTVQLFQKEVTFNSKVIFEENNLSIKEGIAVEKSKSSEERIKSRGFTLSATLPSGGKLDFWLLLSVADIEDAKGDLLKSVVMPTLIALVLGLIASIIFSYYITNPVQNLIGDIAEVSKGNLSHKSSVKTNDEIGLLAETFNSMTELLKQAHEREIQQTAIEHELSIARTIQSNLLPKEKFTIEDIQMEALYKPSKEVGGDYYDYFKIDEDNLGVVIADVSGKGVPASIIMSMFRMLLRIEAIDFKNLSARETMIRVNDRLAKDMRKGMFVTAFYVIINLKDKTATIASAGHNPIYLVRPSESKLYGLNPGGLALGIYSGKLFIDSIKEAKIPLENGDSMLIYTDGVIECTDENYNFFGEDRLKKLFFQLANENPTEIIKKVNESLIQFQNRSEQHDDITMVCLKRCK